MIDFAGFSRSHWEMFAQQGTSLSSAQAAELEDLLERKPGDADVRMGLIGYYWSKNNPNTRANEFDSLVQTNRYRHVLWFVCNFAHFDLPWQWQCGLLLGVEPTLLARMKDEWISQVGQHPQDVRILRHALTFISTHFPDEDEVLEKLNRKLEQLDPENAKESVCSFYRSRMQSAAGESKIAYAQKLTAEIESLAQNDDNEWYRLLPDYGYALFERGELKRAEQAALRLLQLSETLEQNSYYGNAIFFGNMLRGRIALRAGNLAEAKRFLIASGNTPGSPTLNTFGPDFTLAEELAQAGEFATVLQFLELCKRFWRMDQGALEEWSHQIEHGDMPIFGVLPMFGAHECD